jgi:drug/metabolite transporter (DMT)-like permease
MGAIFYKKIGSHVPALGLTFVKCALSLPLFGLVFIFTGSEPVDTYSVFVLCLSGFIGISLGDTFFFQGLRLLSPQTIVLMGLLSHVCTIAFAFAFLGERFTFLTALGMALILFSVSYVIYSKTQSVGDENNTVAGIVYGLLSVICNASAVVITKTVMADVSALQATVLRLISGTLGLLVWGLFIRQLQSWVRPFFQPSLLKDTLLAVMVATFGGFWLFHVAIKYIDVAIANTLIAMEAFFLIPLSALFYKEKISMQTMVGTLVAIGGVILIVYK